MLNCKANSKQSKAEGYNQVPAHHEPHRLGRLCGRNLDNRQLCASGLAHLPHPRCERHIAKHVQLVHSGRGALVGLRRLDGGLAHHYCQHYHHQFGVDDFMDEAALPLKIEFVGATCPTFFEQSVLKHQVRHRHLLFVPFIGWIIRAFWILNKSGSTNQPSTRLRPWFLEKWREDAKYDGNLTRSYVYTYYI